MHKNILSDERSYDIGCDICVVNMDDETNILSRNEIMYAHYELYVRITYVAHYTIASKNPPYNRADFSIVNYLSLSFRSSLSSFISRSLSSVRSPSLSSFSSGVYSILSFPVL